MESYDNTEQSVANATSEENSGLAVKNKDIATKEDVLEIIDDTIILPEDEEEMYALLDSGKVFLSLE